MTDPARQERIEAAWGAMSGDCITQAEELRDVARALEAADTIEPRPVYLTAEEREAVLRWLIGTTPRTYPADVTDGRLLDSARTKLQAAQEQGENCHDCEGLGCAYCNDTGTVNTSWPEAAQEKP